MSDEQSPPACPACSFPLLGSAEDYCPRCEAPVSRSSTFDPLKIIRTEGQLFRRGARRPSGIVVLGMWLLFGPTLFLFAVVAVSAGPVGVLAFSPFLVLYGGILFKVTSRFNAARHDLPEEEEEEEEEEESQLREEEHDERFDV